MSNTVKLTKYSNNVEEKTAYDAIIPGMLVERYGTVGKIRKHATANGNAIPKFVLEDELQGQGLDDEIAAGEKVQVWTPYRGDKVNALLSDGENVAEGDWLASNGDGYLQKFVGGDSGTAEELPLEIVAQALEAVDRSTSSGGDTNTTGRIKVEAV
jgi:hypothetical protein